MRRKPQVEVHPTDPLVTLERCGGYYDCPKDASGKRLGPLVGYAGRYDDSSGVKQQWVGDTYVNCAKADEHPHVLNHFADHLVKQIWLDQVLAVVDGFCGAPLGGYGFAQMLGLATGLEVIKAEKKTIALATSEGREKSELVFARHTVEELRYGIVEDVCNNFSTTEQLMNLIYSLGGKVTAIFCILNRSPSIGAMYYPPSHPGYAIPVFSVVRKIIPEYRQDDPVVASDIKEGNVVWKPKDQWDVLMSYMQSRGRG